MASVYKVMLWMDSVIESGGDPWKVLNETRKMLRQPPFYIGEDVTYTVMRAFIVEFPVKWKLRPEDFHPSRRHTQ